MSAKNSCSKHSYAREDVLECHLRGEPVGRSIDDHMNLICTTLSATDLGVASQQG